MALPHLVARQPTGRRLHDLELGDCGLSEPAHLLEPLPRRADHFRERAEPGEQRLCQRLHIAPRDGAEQHELEELVIGECLRAGFEEARAQAHAVLVVVRWLGREHLRERRRIPARGTKTERGLRLFSRPKHGRH